MIRFARPQMRGLCRAGMIALGLTTAMSPVGFHPASAQVITQSDPNAELLLNADELIYDNDQQIVTARGNVQLDYDGYNVVAQRVSYNRRTRRVKAFGNVEIIEPDGNRIYAQEIDLTDDFADGFVNSLRVETTDNTRFAAESGERLPGKQTVFNNGVYTACEPCRDNPTKPPIWQIKAEKVVLDGVEKTVEYRNASFELFGRPIAFLPYFRHADPSVKRKRGFLLPRVGVDDELGYWYRQSYFVPTSQSTDLTFTLGGYSEQGVLGDVRWRHQLENGFYSIRAAAIQQQNPDQFAFRPDNAQEGRAMVATEGRYDINPNWKFGWRWLEQSDSNFARTYDIKDWSERELTNQVYLHGLANRSSFQLSTMRYLIQTPTIVEQSDFYEEEDQQAFVRPLLDYNYETTDSPLEGLVSFDFNVQSISRDRINAVNLNGPNPLISGMEGNSTRVTADLEWKRTFNAAGLLLTPELGARGDFTNVNESGAFDTPNLQSGSTSRFMPVAGLTASYPLLVRGGASTHIFEPVAQIYARPNLDTDNAFVNEDAQSLVFDTTNLLQRDKFSGYDRIEEGVRANLALRYSGQFTNQLTVDAVVGQSFHLAGRNSFNRTADLVNVGLESGLEDDVSDIVASTAVGYANRYKLSAEGRFDNDTLALARTTIGADYTGAKARLGLGYTFIAKQPALGFDDDRAQVTGRIDYNINDRFSVRAGMAYDIEEEYRISDYVGLSYADECFSYSLNFNRTLSRSGRQNRSITFSVGFRTLGDFGYTATEDQLGLFGVSNEVLGDADS